MKKKVLERFLAATLAASMVLTSVPVSAEDVQAVPEAAGEVAADEPAAAEEAAAEETAAAAEEALAAVDEAPVAETVDEAQEMVVEENTAGGDFAGEELIIDNEITETEAFDMSAFEIAPILTQAPEKPGQVANVHFDKDDPNLLVWNADVRADYYELQITDAKGNAYYADAYESNWDENGNYIEVPRIVTSSIRTGSKEYDLEDLYGTAVGPDGQIVKSEDGTPLTLKKQPGLDLSISVRAVNESNDENDGFAPTAGDWSAAVAYKTMAAKTPEVLSDVRIEDGRLYYTSTSGCSVELSITDETGKVYYGNAGTIWDEAENKSVPYYQNYNSLYSGKPLSDIQAYTYTLNENGYPQRNEEEKAFVAGKTYTLNLREYTGSYYNKDRVEGAWLAQALTYAPAAPAQPQKTGNVRYDSGSEVIRWNPVENVLGYEVEATNTATGAKITKEIYAYNSSSYTYWWIDSDDGFEAGQTYSVTVRSYVDSGTKDAATGEMIKLWSEASEACTFTYGDKAVEVLGKVEGLAVTTSGRLRWNSVDGASNGYEISVKDAAGTEYFTNSSLALLKQYGSSFDLRDDYDFYKFVQVDGQWVHDIHPETGDYVRAFEAGQTYTVSVRAAAVGSLAAGEWSSVTYAIPQKYNGENSTPAKVTGLEVKTAASQKDGDTLLEGAVLVWNAIEKASRYELLIKDAAGNEYTYEPTVKADGTLDKKDKYPKAGTAVYPKLLLTASWLRELNAWVKNAGSALTTVKGADGKALEAMTPGQAYTLQVRAVNVYTDPVTDEETLFEGEWSDAVSFTVNAAAPLAGLRYASSDEDYYYFDYTSAITASIWYQIATDETFSAASLMRDWNSYTVSGSYTGGAKFKISKNAYDLKAGQTYYVRAVSGTKQPTKEELASLTPAVASFTTEAAKTAKAITGLKLYESDDPYFTFHFDAVLEEGDDYELQYAPQDTENWVSVGQTTSLNLESVADGTYKVRAVAYVWNEQDKKVYGTPSNIITVTKSTATTSISGLKLAEKTQDGFEFTFTGTLRANEEVEYWISETSSFDTNVYPGNKTRHWTSSDKNGFTVYYSSLKPGKKYYVRARVYNENAAEGQEYSGYTNIVSVKAAMPKVSVASTVITNKAITLEMDATTDYRGWLSGYQVQRKIGKKYVTMTKTTNSVYKSSGLTANTTYGYRVRPYYYDKDTKKAAYGSWVYAEAATWGGALNLKTAPKSKNSVKISWDQVAGATGYEVYRTVASSRSTENESGKSNGFTKWVLVKDLKASQKSYTEKGLTADLGYSYKVRAYKTVGKKTYYIESSQFVSLAFPKYMSTNISNVITYADGKTKVSWDRSYKVDGYVVEKQDSQTDEWTVAKKLKASAVSYTFAAVKKDTKYRIRAYKGNEYSYPWDITISPALAAPTGVKAKAKADGSITVSWKKVNGADYYKVFRTTSSLSYYDKDAKKYSYTGAEELNVYVPDSTKISGYDRLEEDELTATSMTDRPISYTVDGVTNTLNAGPAKGVTYYYFVVACKKGTAYNFADGSYVENGTSVTATEYGSKAASAVVTGVTKVAKPKQLKVKAAAKKVTLTWKKVSGAAGYEIYRSDKKKSGYEKIGEVTKDTTKKYVDKTAKKGSVYYYKIRAVKENEAGATVYSEYTAPKKVTAK